VAANTLIDDVKDAVQEAFAECFRPGDTDNGRGVDGLSMAGSVVRVVLLGGRVLLSDLRPDPSSSVSRAVAGF